MQTMYYDRDGCPVSRQQWEQLDRQPAYTRVDHDQAIRHGREITVATFWHGAATCGELDAPLIFHSCGEIRRRGDRCATYRRLWGWPDLETARAGHQAVLAWLAEVTAWLAGETSQLPGLPPGQAAPVPPAAEGR
jgi:hypothetical protein